MRLTRSPINILDTRIRCVYRILPCVIFSLLLLNACSDKDIIVPIDTSFPFGQINYTDSALFSMAGLEDIVKPNQANVLSIIATQEVEIITPSMIDSLFKLEQQNLPFNASTGLETPTGSAPSATFELPEPILFEVEIEGLQADERIDEVIFADCNVRVDITNAPTGSNFTEAFWEILELEEAENTPVNRTINTNYNIAGCKLTPAYKNGKPIITIKITGKIPNMKVFEGKVIINCKKINSMIGFTGRKVVEINSKEFIFSDKLQDFSEKAEEVFFANPVLTFDFNNTFDVPMLIKIDEVQIDNVPLKLSNDQTKRQFYIKPKSKGYFIFDNSNTEENDLSNKININTKQVSLSTTAIANPAVADGASGQQDTNKINSEDRFSAIYNVELPLAGYLKNLQFEKIYDNVTFKVEDLDWQEITFAFTGENSILMDFDIDLYTFDDNGEPVLLSSAPAKIPSAHSETEPCTIDTSNMPTVILNKSEIDAIEKCRKLMLKYKASTKNIANKEIVRLLAQTSLKLNLIVETRAQPLTGWQ